MNRIRDIWNQGGAAIMGWLHIPSLLAAETLARCGYDGLVLDLQHGEITTSDVLQLMPAIEAAGIEPVVRVQANDAGTIGWLLDFGAYGVIAPLVNTADDAARFAAALHYPPAGVRSFGPRRPVFRHGAGYFETASQTHIALAMIETRQALDTLDAILAVPGFDGTFIGPSDLSIALGRPPRPDTDDPDVLAAIRHIIARSKAAGRRVGIFCNDAAYARRMMAEGCDLVTLAPDMTLMATAARASVAAARTAPAPD